MKIRTAVYGATGYTGHELVRLLTGHPQAELSLLGSKSYTGQPFDQVYPSCTKILSNICRDLPLEEAAEENDVIFLALPHGIASASVTSSILEKCKIIDLGADYRLKNHKLYSEWYGVEHHSPDLIEKSVYGLPELYREHIRQTSLVSNPGCYTTCSILSLFPVLDHDLVDDSSLVIDAKSGVTGAGRGLSRDLHYCETNETLKAYKIASHRHTPEIEQELSIAAGKPVTLTFTPHLIPMNRGILVTAYASLKKDISQADLAALYRDFYRDEPFVRVMDPGLFPETRWVKGSNFMDIGLEVDKRTNRLIVIGALDNLMKGAAGQAVQNMNILFGFKETAGLEAVPLFP